MCDISIIVPIYNHGNYLEEAINSILMQKLVCSYEVLIGEDCSTDNSRDVLKKLQHRLPSNFFIYYREYNYGSRKNFEDLYFKMTGKYYIILEGDDFWNYEYKLQKQFDFLETHPDYIAVAHRCLVVGKNGEQLKYKYPECNKTEFTSKEFLKQILPGQTATILSKNYITYPFFDRNIDVGDFEAGDRVRAFLLFAHGKIKCIQEEWSSYRFVLIGGSSYSAVHKTTPSETLSFYKAMYKYTLSNNDIAPEIRRAVEMVYIWLLVICWVLKIGESETTIKSVFKNSNNKIGLIFHIFKRMTCMPFRKIKSKINQRRIEKIKKLQRK